MSGHSHWARIKHQKGTADAKKGKVFSKLAKQVTLAARGGGDPDKNLTLRYAIDKAREANMPRDNIDRAIKRGTGELGGAQLEIVSYEGYGPGGAAVIAEAATDNRNRTAPEVRRIFEDHGGNLGTAGCVSWNFETKGTFLISAGRLSEEALTEAALELGADDVRSEEEGFLLLCDPKALERMRDGLKKRGITPEHAEIGLVPKSTIALSSEMTRKALDLVDALQDHDDIQNVYSNLEYSPELTGTASR
jgi:YebC/PmpR family DNA-binding regulatory protein